MLGNKRLLCLCLCVLLFVIGWVPVATVLAKPFGQYYGFIGGLRLNSTVILFDRVDGKLDSVSLANGIYIVAGDSNKLPHLADIGFIFYQHQFSGNIDFKAIPTAFGMRDLNLGYVYHYSTNYNSMKKSHNVHIGFGIAYHQLYLSLPEYEFRYEARGSYFRISYFRIFPLQLAKPLIIGFHLALKSFSNASLLDFRYRQDFTASDILASSEGGPQAFSSSEPSALNNVEIAIILGSPF